MTPQQIPLQYVAYERPALSKAYLFPEGFARLPGFHATVGGGGERQEPSWYQDHGIAYITSTRITAFDASTKTLTTHTGDIITYDKLMVSTGARPVSLADFKTPGADLQGVHYLRDVEDADKLIQGIASCKASGNKAVCIGGGYIGMECAAALSLNGVAVTMVFPESRLFERLFTPEMASFYEAYYADKGITMVKGTLAIGVKGDDAGHVTGVQLKDGSELECSLVVVGVGARPNVDLFSSQLDLLTGPPGGIKVDGHLKTSAEGVWAVGDVAAFPQALEGGALTRQEHVANCRASAAYAMKDMLQGNNDVYSYQPFFYSRVFSLSWQFYGLSRGDVVHFGDMTSGKFGAFWVFNGKVVGAFLESGSADEFAAIKKVAALQPDAPENLGSEGLDFASKL